MFSFFKIQFSVDYRSNRSKSKANHLLLFLIWIMVPFDQEDQRLYSEIAEIAASEVDCGQSMVSQATYSGRASQAKLVPGEGPN